jgi:adenosylhomocysteine nucleosidase
MSNVLVVSALPEETEYIADYVKGKPQWEQLGEDHFRNVEKDVNIRVKVLGVGKVNAAFSTADGIHEANPDLIVNIGVAGGLADDLDRGSVAIGTDYVHVYLHTLLP